MLYKQKFIVKVDLKRLWADFMNNSGTWIIHESRLPQTSLRGGVGFLRLARNRHGNPVLLAIQNEIATLCSR